MNMKIDFWGLVFLLLLGFGLFTGNWVPFGIYIAAIVVLILLIAIS